MTKKSLTAFDYFELGDRASTVIDMIGRLLEDHPALGKGDGKRLEKSISLLYAVYSNAMERCANEQYKKEQK